MNILVTGISRGLGLEIATTLLQQGSVVYGVGRTVSERLQELQAQFGGRLFYQQVDLGDPPNGVDRFDGDHRFVLVGAPVEVPPVPDRTGRTPSTPTDEALAGSPGGYIVARRCRPMVRDP